MPIETPLVFTSNVMIAGSSSVYVAITSRIDCDCDTETIVACGALGSANAAIAASAVETPKNNLLFIVDILCSLRFF